LRWQGYPAEVLELKHPRASIAPARRNRLAVASNREWLVESEPVQDQAELRMIGVHDADDLRATRGCHVRNEPTGRMDDGKRSA
jgi:hypothetical protein